MTLLPLTTCAQLLGIHPKTLHGWLKEANLPLALHPTDARIKCLQEHHLQEVARRHDRSLADPALGPVLLEEHVSSLPTSNPCESDLMQQVSCLETKVARLQEHLAELALALLAEREHAFERRMVSLEATMAQLLGSPIVSSPLPQEPPVSSAQISARVDTVPKALNPAEQRARLRLPALVEYGADGRYVIVSPLEGELNIVPESAEWFEWLATISSFRFIGQSGRLTAYRESRRSGPTRSWTAHRSAHQRRYKQRLGVTDRLTLACLEHVAATLQAEIDAF